MISNLIPYHKYKQTGIPWIGYIPAHWEMTKFGRVLCERGEVNTDEKIIDVLSVMKAKGVIPYKEKGNIGNKKSDDITRYKIVRPDDIVMNSMNVIIGSVGLSKYTGCLSPVYYVLKVKSSQNNPKYFALFFEAKPFQRSLVRIGNGILAHRMRIPMELLKYEPFLVPPLDEQAAIVRFLDHTGSRIKRYIRAKQKLIKLLNEQKQAVIHQAVTRGLDPNVPLKPSGVEWLGDIPEHWELCRIKQVTQILRGKFTHRPRNDPSLYDGDYPFIQTGEVARATKKITGYKQTLNNKGLAVSKMFPAGTLLMTIAANIGDVAILDFEACFPDSIVGFVPKEIVNRDYLYYLFCAMKPEFLREAPVNTQGNLNVERIGGKMIVIPPLSEQFKIIYKIEEETLIFEKAIEDSIKHISLLQEYHTRLIADVVTGKLDVRTAASQLPAELEELEPVEDLAEEIEELEDTEESIAEET